MGSFASGFKKGSDSDTKVSFLAPLAEELIYPIGPPMAAFDNGSGILLEELASRDGNSFLLDLLPKVGFENFISPFFFSSSFAWLLLSPLIMSHLKSPSLFSPSA
jgi:hypothetical protein